jgi:hypothetical protein
MFNAIAEQHVSTAAPPRTPTFGGGTKSPCSNKSKTNNNGYNTSAAAFEAQDASVWKLSQPKKSQEEGDRRGGGSGGSENVFAVPTPMSTKSYSSGNIFRSLDTVKSPYERYVMHAKSELLNKGDKQYAYANLRVCRKMAEHCRRAHDQDKK